ncbi:MAG TPA: hypothetical protein VFE57_07260 [Cyclobacteriaceae bacterium]|nr:hypothetical protein [Cyclobacteriaceae bacterium]
MRYFGLLFLVLLICGETHAQNSYEGIPSPFFTSNSHSTQSRLGSRLRLSPDRQQYYKPKSIMFNTVTGSMYPMDMYWMSSMTTQSYNHGKIGRFYLWDVQGNLRESKMFFDIAGKNKRGLKLVFSKFRFGS